MATARAHTFLWHAVLYAAVMFTVIALMALLITIINNAFGMVAVANTIDPKELVGNQQTLEDLDSPELISILEERLSTGFIRKLNFDLPLQDRAREQLRQLVVEHVVEQYVTRSWSLFESLFARRDILAYQEESEIQVALQFRSWLTPRFLTSAQSDSAEKSGVRVAILGSLWMMALSIAISFPIGVSAAIYLAEYAPDTRIVRFLQTNIYNLSGMPSILYGILGLTIFVRMLAPITSGAIFGIPNATAGSGRTILSAGATLALLILPIIIINAQEALKAAPQSLRDASYGVGATRWQTIRHHILPYSFDRVLTGGILATSRAVGETAPLVVIGAATFIVTNPATIFSKFTTLPIQIYQWTARPQGTYRAAAAAAIIVLLALLLVMNITAIILRNKMSRQKRDLR